MFSSQHLHQKLLSKYPALQAELTKPENEALINKPGHHLNIMQRESVLGLWSEEFKNNRNVRKDLIEPRITACSLPGLIPSELHQASPGFFIRGEFLIVAYFGNSPDCGYVPNSGALLNRIWHDLRYLAGKQVLYRMTDVLPSDFNFLGTRDENAARGAEYLLQNRELLMENIFLAKAMRDVGASLKILVPHTSNPEEYKIIRDICKSFLADTEVGLMVETKDASLNLKKFADCEIFFPGPSDLLSELQQMSRGEFSGAAISEEMMNQVCINFKTGLLSLPNPRVYTIKDMNNMRLPESCKRTAIYTTPELFIETSRMQELLRAKSLS